MIEPMAPHSARIAASIGAGATTTGRLAASFLLPRALDGRDNDDDDDDDDEDDDEEEEEEELDERKSISSIFPVAEKKPAALSVPQSPLRAKPRESMAAAVAAGALRYPMNVFLPL